MLLARQRLRLESAPSVALLTEHEFCDICSNPARTDAQLCVVESPADLFAIEQAGGFRGKLLCASRASISYRRCGPRSN